MCTTKLESVRSLARKFGVHAKHYHKFLLLFQQFNKGGVLETKPYKSKKLANNDGMDFILSKKRQSCMIDDAGVRLPIQRAGSLCMLPYRLPTQVETEKTKSKQRTGLIASLITFAAVLAAKVIS